MLVTRADLARHDDFFEMETLGLKPHQIELGVCFYIVTKFRCTLAKLLWQ